MKKNKGFTLVSLMVGLLISLMTVLALLAMYKTSIKLTFGQNGINDTAIHDSQIGTTLITLENLLQSGGYGIPSAAINTNLILLNNASLSTISNNTTTLTGTKVTIDTTVKTGNGILFESNSSLGNSTTYTCHGFVIDTNNYSVYYLNIASSCNPISTNFNSKTWNVNTLIQNNILKVAPNFTITKSTTCWPYGSVPQTISSLTPNAGGILVQFQYTNSANGNITSDNFCLVNFS